MANEENIYLQKKLKIFYSPKTLKIIYLLNQKIIYRVYAFTNAKESEDCLPAKEPSPLGSITGLGDEEPDGVGSDLLVAGVDPDVPPLILPEVSGQTCHPLTY